tara:strand:+ start:155 stop:709 length:555 start_codon:yes stop_codon:yes gene_type:complete
MKIKNKLALITLLSTAAFSTHAGNAMDNGYKNNGYIGGSVNLLSYEEPGVDADLVAVSGRLGTFITENFSVEGRLGFGLVGDDVDITGTNVDVDLNYIFGVYARAGLPVNENIYPYVLLGYSRGEVEASAGSFSVEEAESDVSFGFGVDFKLNDKLTLNAEYVNLIDKDDVEVSGFNLGASVSF